MEHGASFLRLAIPKVLFVDPRLVHEMNVLLFSCAENDRSLISMCRIIACPFEDLPLYNQMAKWRTILTERDKYSPGYFVLVHSKPFFVKKAMGVYPSQSIGFLDFGISYINEIPPGFVANIPQTDHFRIMFLQHLRIANDFETAAKKVMKRSSGFHHVSAQFWYGSCSWMMEFINRTDRLCKEMIRFAQQDPVMLCLEENLFYLALYFNSDLRWNPMPFQPWLGTYTDVLYNVSAASRSMHQVCAYSQSALLADDHQQFGRIAPYLLRTLREKSSEWKDKNMLTRLIQILIWGLYYQEDETAAMIFDVVSVICSNRLIRWCTSWADIVENLRFYWRRFRPYLPL